MLYGDCWWQEGKQEATAIVLARGTGGRGAEAVKKVVRFWIYFEDGLIAQDLFAYSALKKHLIIIPTI